MDAEDLRGFSDQIGTLFEKGNRLAGVTGELEEQLRPTVMRVRASLGTLYATFQDYPEESAAGILANLNYLIPLYREHDLPGLEILEEIQKSFNGWLEAYAAKEPDDAARLQAVLAKKIQDQQLPPVFRQSEVPNFNAIARAIEAFAYNAPIPYMAIPDDETPRNPEAIGWSMEQVLKAAALVDAQRDPDDENADVAWVEERAEEARDEIRDFRQDFLFEIQTCQETLSLEPDILPERVEKLVFHFETKINSLRKEYELPDSIMKPLVTAHAELKDWCDQNTLEL